MTTEYNTAEIKDIVSMGIDNFILYYTSNENERKNMRKVLNDFMNEVYEENE